MVGISFELFLNLITLVAFLLLVVKYATFAFTHYRLMREGACSKKRSCEDRNEVPGVSEDDVTSTRSPSACPSDSDIDRDRDGDYDSDDTAEAVTLVVAGDFGETTRTVTSGIDDGADFTNTHQSVASSRSPSRKQSLSSCGGRTPFRLSSSLSQSQRCERQITSVLNKLTRERFESLYQQLINVCCSEEAGPDIIHVVAREVFAKATTQHTLAEMYAEVCAKLYIDFATTQSKTPESALEFKRQLLGQCQSSFHAYLTPPNIDTSLDEEERYEELTKHKTKMLGNLRFIAHLIRQRILSSQIIFDCTDELLKTGSVETLESLCTLLSSLGSFFDAPEWHGDVKLLVLYGRIRLLSEDANQTSRIRFLMKNVLDERNSRSSKHSIPAEEPAQAAATPIAHDPMLLALAKTKSAEEAITQESAGKRRRGGGKRKKQERGATNQMEHPKIDTPKSLEKKERSDERAGQNTNHQQNQCETREKHETSEMRKKSDRRSKGNGEGVKELDSKSKVAKCADPKLIRTTKPSSSNLALRRKDGERKSICRLFVGIEDDSDFQVCRRLIGPGGENMKRITSEAAEAKIRIRGVGSKYLEGPNHEESSDPLMICVSATSQAHFERAVSQVEILLDNVHKDYRGFCTSRGLPVPTLSVHRENLRVVANA